MAMSAPITTAIGSELCNAPDPANTRTSRISSVAYAEDDSASDEKIASAFTLFRRSCMIWALANALPRTMPLTVCKTRSKPPGGVLAARVAAMWPGATRLKRWRVGTTRR